MALVCVTGASGYVAQELVKQLLEKGYRVRGTVRSLKDEKKVEPLRSLGDVELVEADLMKPGSFDSAFKDCECVFHTASPVKLKTNNPKKDLIEPAVEGTKNVLSAVEKNPSVKTIIITSSTAAIIQSQHDSDKDKVWTEDDWNTTATLEHAPYNLSKTLAEQAAWEWSKEHPDVRMVAINPGAVYGPVHSKRVDSESIYRILTFFNGEAKREGVPPCAFGIVDNRDVALGHILAFENDVTGRFILCSERGIPFLDLLKHLDPKYTKYPLPTKTTAPVTYIPKFSNERARKMLGLKFKPLEDTMNDMVESFLSQGLLEPQE